MSSKRYEYLSRHGNDGCYYDERAYVLTKNVDGDVEDLAHG